MNQENNQALPQGDNAPLTDLLLQLPGVTKDSAATGSFHVRNEHAYMSTILDPTTGFSTIVGTTNKYQIPNNPGQIPQFTAFGITDFNSALLNENQIERNSVRRCDSAEKSGRL